MFNLRRQGDQPKPTAKFGLKKVEVKFRDDGLKNETFDNVPPNSNSLSNGGIITPEKEHTPVEFKPEVVEERKASLFTREPIPNVEETEVINDKFLESPMDEFKNEVTFDSNSKSKHAFENGWARDETSNPNPFGIDTDNIQFNYEHSVSGYAVEILNSETNIENLPNDEPSNNFSDPVWQANNQAESIEAQSETGVVAEKDSHRNSHLAFAIYSEDPYDQQDDAKYDEQINNETEGINDIRVNGKERDPFEMYDEGSNSLTAYETLANGSSNLNGIYKTEEVPPPPPKPRANFFARPKESSSSTLNDFNNQADINYNFNFSKSNTNCIPEKNKSPEPVPNPQPIQQELYIPPPPVKLPQPKLITPSVPVPVKPKVLPRPNPVVINKTPITVIPQNNVTYTPPIRESHQADVHQLIDYQINSTRVANWGFVGDTLLEFDFKANTFREVHSSSFAVLKSQTLFETPATQKYSPQLFEKVADDDAKIILDHLIQKAIENPNQLISRRYNFNFILMIVNQILSKQMHEQEFYDLENSLNGKIHPHSDDLAGVNQNLLEFISSLPTLILLDNKQSLLQQFKKSFEENRGLVMKAYFKFCIKTQNYQEVISLFQDVDVAILLLFKIYMQNAHDFEARNFEDIILFAFENCSKEAYKILWLLLDPQIALKPAGFNFILSKANDKSHFEAFEFVFWILRETKLLNLAKKDHADLYCFFILFNMQTILANGNQELFSAYLSLVNEHRTNTTSTFTNNPFIQSYLRYYRELILTIREQEQKYQQRESLGGKSSNKGNIFSFVNKILTVGKAAEKTPEEPEEKIVYDPITKRYYVNGKMLTEDAEEPVPPPPLMNNNKPMITSEQEAYSEPPPPPPVQIRPPVISPVIPPPIRKNPPPPQYIRTISEPNKLEQSHLNIPPMTAQSLSTNYSSQKESDQDSLSTTNNEVGGAKVVSNFSGLDNQQLKRKNQLAKNRFIAFPQK